MAPIPSSEIGATLLCVPAFVVRLQVDTNGSKKILEILASNLPIDKQDVCRIKGSIGLGAHIQKPY